MTVIMEYYPNLRSTFWLDSSMATPQMKTDRLDVSKAVTGSVGIRSRLNMSRPSNKVIYICFIGSLISGGFSRIYWRFRYM